MAYHPVLAEVKSNNSRQHLGKVGQVLGRVAIVTSSKQASKQAIKQASNQATL
jgi:hypothetical protein